MRQLRQMLRLSGDGTSSREIAQRLAGKSGEDAVENTETAPANEALVERLVRAVVRGRILPPQTADHVDEINSS